MILFVGENTGILFLSRATLLPEFTEVYLGNSLLTQEHTQLSTMEEIYSSLSLLSTTFAGTSTLASHEFISDSTITPELVEGSLVTVVKSGVSKLL